MNKHPVTLSLQGCFELLLDWHDSMNLSPATIQFYVDNIGRFIVYLADEHNLESPLVADFKAEYIKEYLKEVKNSRKWEHHTQIRTKDEKVGSQSVRTYTRALRAFGNWLFTEGFIKENILELMKLPKATDKIKEVLNDSEIGTILQTFNLRPELGLRNAIIFTFAYDVGIREGGIANLRITDVDLKEKTVRVRLEGGNITILPIGNTLTKRIREYIVKYRGLGKEEEPLLVNNVGGKLTENAIKECLQSLNKVVV